MRYLKYFALLTVLMLPLAYSQAQVRVGVGIGVGPGYIAAGPPVCAYGYYDYAPYACAPYGFYGPDYFVGGVFIGAGPWYHWGHPAEFWGHRGFGGRGFYGRPGYVARGFHGAPAVRGGAPVVRGGGGFHGGAGFHGGGFHGGGRR